MPSYDKRFSDQAIRQEVHPNSICEHDLHASALKMLGGLNKGSTFSDLDSIVGLRSDRVGELAKFEEKLPQQAKGLLVDWVLEALEQVHGERIQLQTTFKISSEAIWVELVDGLQKEGADWKKIALTTSNDFNHAVVLTKRRLERAIAEKAKLIKTESH